MRNVLKSYTIGEHTIELATDNVCAIPFYVVLADGKELYVCADRQRALHVFGFACTEASEELGVERKKQRESEKAHENKAV